MGAFGTYPRVPCPDLTESLLGGVAIRVVIGDVPRSGSAT